MDEHSVRLTDLFLLIAAGMILAALLGRLVVGTDATTLEDMTFASADTILLISRNDGNLR